MRIAIVAPSPVPFGMGGAESLWVGLQRAINEQTSCHCELLKVRAKEDSIVDLLQSYERFLELDLKDFDVVLTGKYPAWMVNHHDHRIYMLHKLRGLYDTYPFRVSDQYTDFPIQANLLSKLLAESQLKTKSVNEEVSDVICSLLDDISSARIPSEVLAFPGPFSRNIIHSLDGIALDPNRVSSYAAISNVVRSRESYFPQNAPVKVLYPPPELKGMHCGGDEYFFTASRLDGPKRISLLIDAMKFVEGEIPLVIAGSGPEEEALKKQAADDERIRFVGRLSGSELVEMYANALAVPFVPYEEDYGLVTIEAMMSSKPVVTTTDAGGVNEFVIDGQTGLCVPPDPEALGRALNSLASNRSGAKEMGVAALSRVSDVTWQNVVHGLIPESQKRKTAAVASKILKPSTKKRIVVVSTFPIYPPRGGGQSRIFHLYKQWAKHFEVTICCLTGTGDVAHTEVAPNLIEIRVARSEVQQKTELELMRAVGGVPITDIVDSHHYTKTPQFLEILRRTCGSADIVVASHPYLVNALIDCAPGSAELWFEVHNVELGLKTSMLPESQTAQEMLGWVKHCEGIAWKKAAVAFACSSDDLVELERIYGPSTCQRLEVPNGFSPDEVSFVPLEVREQRKKELGLADRPVAIFMGSWHVPNLEAVQKIVNLADGLPEVLFIVIGSSGLYFEDKDFPANIRMIGEVDEEEKQILLSSADLALNPMTSGSGSNLKMLDYFAAGVPVLSTSFGARGLRAKPGVHYISSTIAEFSAKIFEFFVELGEAEKHQLIASARELAHTEYSWITIAENALSSLVIEKNRKNL